MHGSAISDQVLVAEQVAQYKHDQKHHFEILSLSKADRLKHYGLHFSKYVGRLARGDNEVISITQTVTDSFIICLSAANTLNQQLSIPTTDIIEPKNDLDLLLYFADASGRFADACEKIDHLENFLNIALCANVDVMSWILNEVIHLNIDLIAETNTRREFLSTRNVYGAN